MKGHRLWIWKIWIWLLAPPVTNCVNVGNFLISLGCILYAKLDIIVVLPTVQDDCAKMKGNKMCEWCFVNHIGLCTYVWFIHDHGCTAAKLSQWGSRCFLSHGLGGCTARNLLTSFCRWPCLPPHWEYAELPIWIARLFSIRFTPSHPCLLFQGEMAFCSRVKLSSWITSFYHTCFKTLLHSSTPISYLPAFLSSQSDNVFKSLAPWKQILLT